MTDYIIVTRHEAAIRFIHSVMPESIGSPVRESVKLYDVCNKTIIGNVPMHIATVADYVIAIEFDRPPRGQELTLDDMRQAGARLRKYCVHGEPMPIPTLLNVPCK